MTITHEEATSWLARHDAAFRAADMDDIINDYAEDAILEVHTEGVILRFSGHEEILAALMSSNALGIETKAERVMIDGNKIFMQVVDPNGYTLVASVWEVEGGKITHDLAVIPVAPAKTTES